MKVLHSFFFTLLISVCCLYSTGINASEKKYQLWYDKPAPNAGIVNAGSGLDSDWENWSLPMGNGYMGVCTFGRTDTERMQITENTLCNAGCYGGTRGGLTNFAEMYIDFSQPSPSNYRRSLCLNNAVQQVEYTFNGVSYKRESFCSYPDKVLVLKLTADQAGSISFKLRPTIPYLRDYGKKAGDNDGRTGTVIASGNIITLSGKMMFFNELFEGQFRVINYGGTSTPANDANGTNGSITVQNADSALIIVAVGTNYQLQSSVFSQNKPELKLSGFPDPHTKVSQIMNNASALSFQKLYQRHLEDYRSLFNRVQLDLKGELPTLPTDKLLANYKTGTYNTYLEELYFQFGRFLLISSSRKGCMPANLQGIWNQYEYSPWTGGYWHNINVQMNYWPAFNTNLTDLFSPYIDYYNSYLPAAQSGASDYIKSAFASNYSATPGENGWNIATGCDAFGISTRPGYVGGPGVGGFTTQLFWDYYDFTRDASILQNITYPALLGMSKFLSKVLNPVDKFYLAPYSYSPEQRTNATYYQTIGCGFDQQMIQDNHNNVLKCARMLGSTDAALETIRKQASRLDPVQVGYSGQIKEFREENYYGEIGDPQHRHISQLVGLYPGGIINHNTPAWLDAARVTLNKRGDKSTGWAMAHRFVLWCRLGDGNRAYTLLKTLLSKGTLDNLWDKCPPFQIDGNLGGTAGIAEMLVQSHEGYINILPALTDDWKNGSVSGLLVRGAFEISIDWQNSTATSISVLSKAGAECVINYPNISSCKLTDDAGNSLSPTILSADKIKFPSVLGRKYLFTSIPSVVKSVAPSRLVFEKEASDNIKLIWTPVNNVSGYNVYVGMNSDPSYKLLKKKLTQTTLTIRNPFAKEKGRCTYKVTALAKDGRESEGVFVFHTDTIVKPVLGKIK